MAAPQVSNRHGCRSGRGGLACVPRHPLQRSLPVRTHSAKPTAGTCSQYFTEKTDCKSISVLLDWARPAVDALCKLCILGHILTPAGRRPLLECFPAMLLQLPAELRTAAVAVAPTAFTGQAADFRVQLSDCTLPQPKSRALEPGQTATYSLVYRWGSASSVASDAIAE